jgi:hypothetical protein
VTAVSTASNKTVVPGMTFSGPIRLVRPEWSSVAAILASTPARMSRQPLSRSLSDHRPNALSGAKSAVCTDEAATSSMALLPEIPAVEGVRSLEVRWIFPGQLEAAVARWFGRFPAAMESQEDAYLLDPHLRGLSVKIRGGAALEVKMYGSQGTLDVEGRVHGHIESWQKWSFPSRH